MWYLLDENGDIVEAFEDEDAALMELVNIGDPIYCVVKEENYY